MPDTRGRSRSRLLATALAVFVLAGCAMDPRRNEGAPGPSPERDAGESLVQAAVQTTAAAGDAEVSVRVRALMPKEMDEGVPLHRFGGQGILDQDNLLAGVTYDMGDVPNSAGYYGHVDGEMPVYFTEDGFTLSFDLLETALSGNLAWLDYQFTDLREPRLIALGIGQLREIGLSDPMLALVLARGVVSANELVDPPRGGARAVDTFVDPRTAADSGMRTLALEELVRLMEGRQIPMLITLDDDNRIVRIAYRASYRPRRDAGTVKLKVSIGYTYGASGSIRLPPEREVADYNDYVKT